MVLRPFSTRFRQGATGESIFRPVSAPTLVKKRKSQKQQLVQADKIYNIYRTARKAEKTAAKRTAMRTKNKPEKMSARKARGKNRVRWKTEPDPSPMKMNKMAPDPMFPKFGNPS